MKLSELKKQIKDNIYEILSEGDDTATEKAANTAEINAEKLKIKASQEKIYNLKSVHHYLNWRFQIEISFH